MPTRAQMAAAEATVRVVHAEAERVVSCEDDAGRAAARRLERLLGHADALLGARLRGIMLATGGPDVRFGAAQAAMYREQITLLTGYVRARLGGLTHDQATAAIAASMEHTVDTLAHLEEHFTGIAIPTRLRQALTFDATSRGVRASLLRQHATSVDRYGVAMIEQMEGTLAAGTLAGFTSWDMVNALTGHAGPAGRVSMRATVVAGQVVRLREEEIPEGLFRRYRSWAWRIVRTETASAYNEARLAGIAEMRDEFPDLGKKILATFDNRTAYDSIVVHGQVRPVDGYFTDGAGRQYQRPPGRPNDRETLIPWRMSWPETPATAPLTPEQVGFMQRRLGTNAVRGPGREHDVAEERRALGERRRARQRTQAEERRRARAEGRTVQQVTTPEAHEREAAKLRAQEDARTRREVRQAKPRGPTREERAAAKAAEKERERQRKAAFDAEAAEALKLTREGTIRWYGEQVGELESVGNRHVGLLRFEDPNNPTGPYRYVRGPVASSRRAAAEWVARQRWEAEEEVRAARQRAPGTTADPEAERRARLGAAGVGHLAGPQRPAFSTRQEAQAYLRAMYRAEAVTVAGEAEVSLADLTVIADRLDALPAHQMEHLYQRGTRVRVMPRNVGVGRDPTWGGQTHTFDGRPWDRVEGAYTGHEDTVRVEPGRVAREVMRAERTDTLTHEVGHALSRQTGFRMSDTVEFQRILVEQGGRDALRQHGGWYVSDATYASVEESWAEGFALANTERGRQWLEANNPPLLRYYERVRAVYEAHGRVEMSGWSTTSHVHTTRAGLARQDRARGVQSMIGRTEAAEVERALARRFPSTP